MRRFYEAFNAEDLDAFVAVLHPDVELHAARGIKRGREQARGWATRVPEGELHQRIVLEDVIGDGDTAVALSRRQWLWKGDGRLAADDEMAALFRFRDGLIACWRPFDDRAEAVREAGLEEAGPDHLRPAPPA